MESQSHLWARTRRISPRTADILLVLVLAVPGVIAAVVDPLIRGLGLGALPVALAIGLVLVQSVPLLGRRRWPAAVLVVVAVDPQLLRCLETRLIQVEVQAVERSQPKSDPVGENGLWGEHGGPPDSVVRDRRLPLAPLAFGDVRRRVGLGPGAPLRYSISEV